MVLPHGITEDSRPRRSREDGQMRRLAAELPVAAADGRHALDGPTVLLLVPIGAGHVLLRSLKGKIWGFSWDMGVANSGINGNIVVNHGNMKVSIVMGVPNKGWFIREIPLKMGWWLRVPSFVETPVWQGQWLVQLTNSWVISSDLAKWCIVMQDMIQEMIQDMILLYIAWKCLECVLRVTFSMMSILLLSEFWVDLVQPSHLVLFQRPGPHLTTDPSWPFPLVRADSSCSRHCHRCAADWYLDTPNITGEPVANWCWCAHKPCVQAVQGAQGLGSEGRTKSCRILETFGLDCFEGCFDTSGIVAIVEFIWWRVRMGKGIPVDLPLKQFGDAMTVLQFCCPWTWWQHLRSWPCLRFTAHSILQWNPQWFWRLERLGHDLF